MCELHAGGGSVRAYEIDRRLERLGVRIGPKPEVPVGDATARLDRGGFGHNGGETARREFR